jgi:inhibitor of KinA sporulation pathway (predicted exonuclease)
MAEALVVLDLEATCWPKGTRPERMETIEFGAVCLDARTLEERSEFSSFVRPVDEPVLDAFCRELTGIRQEDVDAAPSFPEVFRAFLAWLPPAGGIVCTWGAYDIRQLRIDCRRHGLSFPAQLESFVNLKRAFSRLYGVPPCGMRRALSLLGISLEGSHHRALDDARNIARILSAMLRSEQPWRPVPSPEGGAP